MPLGERITSVAELKAWTDKIPFRYEYTAGVAGEKFLRGLKKGKIISAHCAKCGKDYVPPKMYCVDDFVATEITKEVKGAWTVAAVALSRVDFQGRPRQKPKLFVYVKQKGVVGGMIHHGMGDGLAVGSQVFPKFRPAAKRKGTMLDLEGFARAKS